ncbi:hypothetical protein DPM33_04930 [Mesorhizobium hawassense]|uniref:MEDS domain-containing protein n=1 Tax=Mesorhizobium hawassense TaxID=1209954 RepID=A0A330HYR2_9HYPH|nr:hypothetical protein DPM33_04930 [Mesorhizobium hawassense]
MRSSRSCRGYPGMRLTGDTIWLAKEDWGHFCHYEGGLNEVIGNRRLAVLCTYPLAACGAPQSETVPVNVIGATRDFTPEFRLLTARVRQPRSGRSESPAICGIFPDTQCGP